MSVSRRNFLVNAPLVGAAPTMLAAAGVAGLASSAATADTVEGPAVFNVRTFGALGNGVTDDTAAINAAINALTDHSALYFPPGRYPTTGLIALAGHSYVTVFGHGAMIEMTNTNNTTWIIESDCAHIHISGLVFGGNATFRQNGVHLRVRASQSLIENCEFFGSSDFGLFVGDHNSSTPARDVQVVNCYAHDTKGDGFHLGNVDGVVFDSCVARNTGDDAFGIVGYESAYTQACNIQLSNCVSYNSQWRGFLLQHVKNVSLIGCRSFDSQGPGIELNADGNYASVFNEDVTIENCTVSGACQAIGPQGGVGVYFSKRTRILNSSVTNTVTTNNFAVFDFDDLLIQGCSARFTRPGFGRGVQLVDQASLGNRAARANWGNLTIKGFAFDHQHPTNNEAIYLRPASSVTVTSVIVDGVSGQSAVTANYISVDSARFFFGKVGNCISTEGRSFDVGVIPSFNMQ